MCVWTDAIIQWVYRWYWRLVVPSMLKSLVVYRRSKQGPSRRDFDYLWIVRIVFDNPAKV